MAYARFFRDIERCPYAPSDPEYDEWMRKDNERLARLENKRMQILEEARFQLSAVPENLSNLRLRQVYEFVIEQLDRNTFHA